MGLAGAASLALAGAALAPAGAAHAASGSGGSPASTDQLFPPRANAIWAYDDTDSGTWDPGRWADLIKTYNENAKPANRISEIYSYGTDMETYCPGSDVAACTLSDLYSYYTASTNGYASTGAYDQDLAPVDTSGDGTMRPFLLSPIIDGRTDAGGYLTNFDDLPENLAKGYADKVAAMVCVDHRIDGIQFDLEPFDVTTKNGQYYFYLQLAKDFAGEHDSNPAADPYGCVDASHPQGRYFSFFTFADAIKPGTPSAANVKDIATTYRNGYILGSLYDLSQTPAGTLTDPSVYRTRVQESVANMRSWADDLGIPYGFGIPATASTHEYTTCTGPGCVATADGTDGYPMLDYTTAAVEALHDNDVVADPLFRGTAIWDLGSSVEWNGNTFTPAPASADTLAYLGQNLTAAPATASVSPDHGQAVGGDTVTVDGDHFVPGKTSVSIDGVVIEPDEVTVAIDRDSLTFVTPAHTPGAVDVTVTTPSGTSTPALTYTYDAVADPGSGGDDGAGSGGTGTGDAGDAGGGTGAGDSDAGSGHADSGSDAAGDLSPVTEVSHGHADALAATGGPLAPGLVLAASFLLAGALLLLRRRRHA